MDGVGDRISSSNLGGTLPHIIRENELQKSLADERMRAEQHKSNYQTLKLDYLRLQQDFSSLQKTFEEMNLLREKDKRLLEQAKQEIIKKVAEIENLKTQILDPHKIKLIQLEVEENIEGPYKDKLDQHKKECDNLKAEYNKLKTDYIFLKSEYENDRKQYLTMLEEAKMKYETEISILRQDKESKLRQENEELLNDFNRMKDLEHENTQLTFKIRSLEQENSELRGQKDYSGTQIDSIARVNSKVVAEYQSTINAFEVERQAAKAQIENLHKELRIVSDAKNQAVLQRLDLDKHVTRFKNEFEEAEQTHKKEIHELKVRMLKEQGSLEEELGALKVLFEDARGELEVMQDTVRHLENSLLEKEKEAVRKIQLAKGESWRQLHQLETEKIELEAKLKEAERKNIENETQKAQMSENLKKKDAEVDDIKEAFGREKIDLSNKLLNQQLLLDQLEKERIENSSLKNRLSVVESKFMSFTEGEKELLDQNDRLERQVAELSKERQNAMMEEAKSKEIMEREFSDKISLLLEEKCRLHAKNDELENHMQHVQRKMISNSQLYKEKKSRLKKLLLKYKSQLVFKQEKDSLEDKRPTGFSSDVEVLRNKLAEVLRKNQEFWNLLTSSQLQEKVIGGLPFASISYDFLPHSNGTLDWDSLKKKLEQMDENLRLQLKEIQGN